MIVVFFTVMILVMKGVFFSSKRHVRGIENVAMTLDELEIPSDIRVIGIGEATHGNREFQIAKLDLLKKMVEEGTCHSIAFEISVGEGVRINDAVHEQESDLTELVGTLDYPLYDTAEMVSLFEWMREYNKDKDYDDSVIFYGIDMQGAYTSAQHLTDFAKEHTGLFSEEEIYALEIFADLDRDDIPSREIFESVYNKLASETDTGYMIAAMCANTILQSVDAPGFDEDANGYGEHRDLCMAQNVKRISEIEEARGYGQIIVTAHNGHVMKGGAESYGETAMGQRIDDLFEGSYFCIGTEFYNTCVNIHTAGTYDEEYERADHDYCSDDVLAYQAKDFGGCYVLDYTSITEDDGEVYKIIHSDNFTGMAGEGYTVYMDLYKTYRIKLTVADRYDAMIYYYETTPIRCLHY